MLIDPPPRRVVTGIDAAGRSCFLFDGPSETVVWRTDSYPIDNSGTVDMGGVDLTFPSGAGQSGFIVIDFPPAEGLFGPGMHATNTIDYIVMISGEVVLITETGECSLRAGDVVVDRGIVHAWRNDSGRSARVGVVMLPAEPVGGGATI